MSTVRFRRFGLPLAAAVLVVHALTVGDYIADDAYITLRYADNLLQGMGPVWNEGMWVEGYSNPTWMLGTALLGLLGLDLVTAARVLGLLCGVGTLWLVHRWAGRGLAGTGAALLVAMAPPVAVWVMGGLEANLIALCLAGALTCALPPPGPGTGVPATRPFAAGLWLALLIWSRPDGPLLAGLVGLGQWLTLGRNGWRPMLRTALAPAIATILLLAVRQALYGEWVPNTAQIKGRVDLRSVLQGWRLYVAPTLLWLVGPAVLLLVAALRPSNRGAPAGDRRAGTALLLLTAAWLLYLVAVGGDLFPGRRHAMPLVVCGALAGALLLQHRGRWAIGLVAAALLSLGFAAVADPANRAARIERWEHLAADLGRTLGHAFGDARGGAGALLAASPAGALPFESRLPTIDMLGLSDPHIARQPPTPGAFYAHNLADMDYVLRQEPDLIAFGGPWVYLDSGFAPWIQVRGRAQFFRDHDILPVFSAPGVDTTPPWAEVPDFKPQFLWLRRNGALGLRIEPDGTVHIPGHLFATLPGAPWFGDGAALPRQEAFQAVRKAAGRGNRDAMLAAAPGTGPVGLFLTPRPVRLRNDLPPGRYRIAIEGSGLLALPPGKVELRCAGPWHPPGDTIEIGPGETLELRVQPPAALRAITLTPER